MTKTDTYTLAELQAMADVDLNALAAELRGVKCWQEDEYTYAEIGGKEKLWRPATNRNQSGELLEWFMTQNESHSFSVIKGRLTCRVRLETTEDTTEIWREQGESLARLETIAFCAAMLAMKGRLK